MARKAKFLQPFRHKNATSVHEAFTLLAQNAGKALPIAGGSDLLGEMKDRIETPELVVNLKTIPGLGSIQQKGNVLSIGALVQINDLADNPLEKSRFPVLDG